MVSLQCRNGGQSNGEDRLERRCGRDIRVSLLGGTLSVLEHYLAEGQMNVSFKAINLGSGRSPA